MTIHQARPVFSRLPIRGYQDNPVADALTAFYDTKLVEVGAKVAAIHLDLDPSVTPSDWLDWLASLVGMVDPYYSTHWEDRVKRLAIAKANEIYRNRGTLKGLELALSIHDLDYQVFANSNLTLPFSFGAGTRFGLASDTVFVRLPLKYPRNSFAFAEARRAVRNYTALVTPTLVCYDRFYLGFSTFGDPLF